MARLMGSKRLRKTTTTRGREKREERREKREDRPTEAARGPTRGANPFLGHTALPGLNLCVLPAAIFDPLILIVFVSLFSLLASLFSLLSSLFSHCCSFLRSHFAPATTNFASGHRFRPQLPRPIAAPSLARRNARSDEIH